MSGAVAYLAGLATLPALLALGLAWEWLTDKNYELSCMRCGRAFGTMNEDYKRVQILRFRLHRRACRRENP